MCFLGLVPLSSAAALPVSCGSIYKSFADCLVTLGDSLGDTQKDPGLQDIDGICRFVLASHSVMEMLEIHFQQSLDPF